MELAAAADSIGKTPPPRLSQAIEGPQSTRIVIISKIIGSMGLSNSSSSNLQWLKNPTTRSMGPLFNPETIISRKIYHPLQSRQAERIF